MGRLAAPVPAQARQSGGRNLVERMLVELRRAVGIDGLTGLLDRSAVLADGLLQQEQEQGRRHGTPLAVLLLDVDHFKQVNDRWGHLADDQVLQHSTGVLQRCAIGRVHLLSRYWGRGVPVTAAGEQR